MIALRTLGAIDIRDNAGRDGGRVLAQPKRFALLAYLAITRVPQRRDTLLALFWPDLDEERARLALRQAVHFLRSTLGAEVISRRSDDALAVGEGLVRCDVTEFGRALDEGRLADALVLYGGDLLTGFHVSDGSAEFDQWLERERQGLRARAARAAWTLAEAAEQAGNGLEAAHRARQAVHFAPDDEASFRRLVSLLDRLGDRAGALREYDEFARRLREEFEVEPSAETLRLLEAVRSRAQGESPTPPPFLTPPGVEQPTLGPALRRPAPTTRWRLIAAAVAGAAALALGVAAVWTRRSGAPMPRTIAVGFVRNEGGDSTADAARLLPGLLATDLARIRGLSVVSETRLYEILGQIGATELTPQAFADAARRAGAVELIEGVLYRRPGGALRLDLRRVDASDGTVRETYTAAGADAFELADRATATIAEAFTLTGPVTPLAAAASGSLVARRFYEEALRAFYRGEWRSAYQLFTAALADDSSFAMAAYYAARSIRWFRVDSEFVLLEKASRLADRSPDRDRLLIKHARDLLLSHPAHAATAESLALRYPNEPDGHLALATARVAAGDFAAAIPHARRVIAMDSLSLQGRTPHCRACEAYGLLLKAYASMGSDSFPAVERTARHWISGQPAAATAWEMLATTLTWRGRREEALQALNKAAQLQPWIMPRALFWDAVIQRETYLVAERRLWDRLRFDERDHEAIWWLVTTLRHQGRVREALAVLARAARPPSWMEAGVRTAAAAQVVFEMGQLREAGRRFEALMRPGPEDPADPSYAAHRVIWMGVQAATAWAAAGDTLRLLELADTIGRVAQLSASGLDRRLPHHVRGLLWHARGQPARAAEEFRAAMYSPTLGYTRTNLELARALLALERPAEAVRVLREVLGGSPDGFGYYLTRTDVHDWLARAFEAAGQMDSAAVHYRLVAEAWKHGDRPYRARAEAARQKLQALGR